jgi:MFS family permease
VVTLVQVLHRLHTGLFGIYSVAFPSISVLPAKPHRTRTDCARTFTCISIVPIANEIIHDLSAGSPDPAAKSSSILLVTIWELGEAAGPLLIAPLSEMFGRSRVMNTANCLFAAATVLAAVSRSVPLLIAARCLTGLAVASNVLNPAIVGDMYASEERGGAMSLIMLAPLLGGAVGPAIAGTVAQEWGWSYVLWMSAALVMLCEALFFWSFRETYKVTILRTRAARLRKQTGNQAYKTEFDDDDDGDGDGDGANDMWSKLGEAVRRPGIVFWDSSVLQALALFGSISFAYFYVMSTTFPDILEDIYHLSPALTGMSFVSFSTDPYRSNKATTVG